MFRSEVIYQPIVDSARYVGRVFATIADKNAAGRSLDVGPTHFLFLGLGNTFVNKTLFRNGSQVRHPSPQRADWRDQLESVFFCENEA
jgi:hypothetical protein